MDSRNVVMDVLQYTLYSILVCIIVLEFMHQFNYRQSNDGMTHDLE